MKCRIGVDGNLAGEAIAATADRLDALLRVSAVANGLADRHHPLRENPFTDKAARPQLLEQFALGDEAVAMLEEIGEDIDGVRLQRTHRPRAPEFVAVGIERTRPKRVDHRDAPNHMTAATVVIAREQMKNFVAIRADVMITALLMKP